MRIAVTGATGVLGRLVVAQLVARGHAVTVLLRQETQAPPFTALGCCGVRGDLLTGDGLASLMAGNEAALHLATAIAVPGRPVPPPGANDRLRREGAANLIAACRAAGVGRYVQQSIALLHATKGDAWGNEATPGLVAPISQSALDMEGTVRRSGLDWRILRGGALYGPGTGRDLGWRQAARAGTLRLPADGSDWISLVHVADMASATVLATEAVSGERAVIIVDDEPMTYRDLFGAIARIEGAAPPSGGGPRERPSFRLSNEAARRWLGWRPAVPAFRLSAES